ncbi:MAG: hypothetical protein ACKVKF_04315 [Rhodobacterales bacterium]
MLRQFSDGASHQTAELAESLNTSARSVSNTAAILIGHGYLTRSKLGEYVLSLKGREALTQNILITSGPNGPNKVARKRRDTFRTRAWRGMRVRRTFTMADLISDADDGIGSHVSNLSRFLGILQRAGYVVVSARRTPGVAKTSPGFKRYRLVKDTGPIAPVHVARTGMLHDFNLEEDVPCQD